MIASDAAIVICGLGAVTPVGRSSVASAAAVRAGIAGFAHHPVMVDVEGRPVAVAAFPWMDPMRGTADRIGDALLGAVEQAVGLGRSRPRGSLGIVLNLPFGRPGLPDDLEPFLGERIRSSLGARDDDCLVLRAGHAGGLIGLQHALQLLATEGHQAVVVAGADSYLDLDALEWLEATGQLHGAGARNNAWGFVPGEAAGALLLAPSAVADRLGLPVLGVVRGLGADRESKLIGSGDVCLGLGLTSAVRQATACLEAGETLSDVYCDLNGEPYRADEYAFTVTRTREHFSDPSGFVAPADCWGDVGAASSVLGVLLACIAGRKHYAAGRTAMVWASSIAGERAAAVLTTH